MKHLISHSKLCGALAGFAAFAFAIPLAQAQTGAPLAASIPAVSTPGAPAAIGSTHARGTLGAETGINVLILALDEADLKSFRPSNLTESKPLRAPENRVVPPPIFPALPNAAPALPLPAAPPLAPAPRNEMPGITPANWQNFGAIWRASAQIAPARAIPDLPSAGGDELEIPNRRPPGAAQIAAAPLRRALVNSGVRDVLTTALDGPTIVRSVNAGRINIRAVDRLRFSIDQLLQNAREGAAAQPTPARQALLQSATQIASRVGLSLNYRAVVVLAIAPGGEYSVLLVDAVNETGEAFVLPGEGIGAERDTIAAASAAATISSRLREWAPFSPADRIAKLESHMSAARAALEKNDLETARDQLTQAVSLDASFADAYILLGDISQNSDPVAAAAAYQRAAEINTRNGSVWARIAITHTLSSPPDWVRALASANKAQSLGYDSANLRTAMAAAEFGRADLFRRSARQDQAEDAELTARRHLERARELAPDDPEVVAGVSRLMGKYMLDQKRYREAVQSLDLLAIQYPNDLQTQLMFARALEGYGKREEDLFAAWSRVWRLGGDSDIALDGPRYARITDGFDQRIFALTKNVFQMTSGVASGALPRETALLQAERARDEMKVTVNALQLMRPPTSRAVAEAHVSRLFAADLMQQAVLYYIYYLETGTDLNRTRAVDLHRQAIEGLNAARNGSSAASGRIQ